MKLPVFYKIINSTCDYPECGSRNTPACISPDPTWWNRCEPVLHAVEIARIIKGEKVKV